MGHDFQYKIVKRNDEHDYKSCHNYECKFCHFGCYSEHITYMRNNYYLHHMEDSKYTFQELKEKIKRISEDIPKYIEDDFNFIDLCKTIGAFGEVLEAITHKGSDKDKYIAFVDFS